MSNRIIGANYNPQLLFLSQPELREVTYTNPSGSEVTIAAGRLMGTVLATGKVLPNISSATDGSEMPRSINYEDVTVAGNATVTIYVAIGGRVDKGLVALGSGDTWGTVVRTVSTGGGSIENLLVQNSQIVLTPVEVDSAYDNTVPA